MYYFVTLKSAVYPAGIDRAWESQDQISAAVLSPSCWHLQSQCQDTVSLKSLKSRASPWCIQY